jgi:hypothetical protein
MTRILLILGLLALLVWGVRRFILPSLPGELAKSLGQVGILLALLLLALLPGWWLAGLGVVGIWLVRNFGLLRVWRQRPQASGAFGNRHGAVPKSVAEAYEVLGLQPGASRAEIIAAHRRLMQKVHPDRGGSGFLAAQINRAKEILLNSHK